MMDWHQERALAKKSVSMALALAKSALFCWRVFENLTASMRSSLPHPEKSATAANNQQ
jgi:hypothetical protein